ncbi:MAG: YcxB family protein [Candidatus Gallimonas sp.]
MVEFRSKLDGSKSRALNNRTFKKLLWMYVLLTVLLIVLGVVGIVLKEDSSDFAAGIGLIVLGVLITPLGYLLSRFLQKRFDKSATYISDDTEEIYQFDEQFITLTQTMGDVFTSTLKARYSYLYKAREDNRCFYLYISKMQSHVIDKSSITQGSLEEVTALLKTNLGDKFKRE